jgi:Ras-related protein Rab-21
MDASLQCSFYSPIAPKSQKILSRSLEINVSRRCLYLDELGQERFHALGPIYYRDADGALLVYDITDAESFNKVKKWVKELRKIVGNDIAIAIAGNKIDLEKNRSVIEQEAIK